ncbi:Cholecystokinin receptor type A [Holothuria leucospilota]|uniref:Cholecystokinin receptor type A n=1 Tax=Holothuria leucospilota TaxID=206669 RepID=A0A9Q1CI05_HOLLE|nr:Cholecystokinin receptor type A [Holothuria leucospilota]
MEIFTTSSTAISGNQPNQQGTFLDDVIQVLHLVFGILGLLGNGLVLVVIARVRSLRTITNLFIAVQSVIDFLTAVCLLLSMYNRPVYVFSDWEVNIWTLFVCHFWQSDYVFWSLMGTSTANLIVLTLERWIAVVFPIIYRNRVTWKRASAFVVLPWVWGFVCQLYQPILYHFENGVCFLRFPVGLRRNILGCFVFFVKLVLPVLIMSVAYISILHRIKPQLLKVGVTTRRTQSTGMTTDCTDSTRTNCVVTDPALAPSSAAGTSMVRGSFRPIHQKDRVRLNILKTLFLVTIVFFVCWAPAMVQFMILNLGGSVHPRGTIYRLLANLVFVNIWINPVIYAFKYRKFQEGLKKTICIK